MNFFHLHQFRLLTVAVLVLYLSACAGIGVLVGGKPKQYTERDSLSLDPPQPDVLDIAEEMGRSLGYSVQRTSHDTLGLSRGSSIGSSLVSSTLTGHVNGTGVSMVLRGNGSAIDIQVMTIANFGVDTRKKAERVMKEIKEALIERIEKTKPATNSDKDGGE